MNKQDELLGFLYDNEEALPLESRKLYQAYVEIEGYGGSQGNFAELVSKLFDKGLVEKPSYGVYDINERGRNKVESLRNIESSEIERAEGYGDVVDELVWFFEEEKGSDLDRVTAKNGGEIEISLSSLDRFNPDLLEFFRENPDDFTSAVDQALNEQLGGKLMQKTGVDYKLDSEWLETDLAKISNSEMEGTPVIVEGLVRKSEDISDLVLSAIFECSTCGDRYEKQQDSSKVKSPYKCDCGSKKFDEVDKLVTNSMDFQISARDGAEFKFAARIMGDVNHETKKDLMAGTKVRLLTVPRYVGGTEGDNRKMDKKLEVLSYEKADKKEGIQDADAETKEKVKEKIEASDDPFDDFAESLAPNLGDIELPKKLVTASLIGSSPTDFDDGRIHVGIFSNPGLGKSELQEWVNDEFNNTFRTEGESGTGTGLTASVEQSQGGEWQLVAGKLVFADKGILQIDEVDKFAKGDLAQLNTAMESGFFRVDKATVSAELPGRATIIMSGNFESTYQGYDAPVELLPEKGEGVYDRLALMCAITESGKEAEQKMGYQYLASDEKSEEDLFSTTFSPKELRVFRHLARIKDPMLSQEALEEIKNWVHASNSKKESDEGEIRGKSNRMFKQLIKVTLAVARSNLRDKAVKEDAHKACKLMQKSKKSLGLEFGDSEVSTEIKERRKFKTVKDAFDKLQEDEDPVEKEELIEEVTENSEMSDKQVEKVIDKIGRNGVFYEPQYGHLQKI